ncbi:MAG: hydroxyisourate hydrolase [Rhodospirillales bacterium]
MAGRLTTHVLDTAHGRPAAGVWVDLYRVDGEARRHLVGGATNADGRLDQPLVEGAAMAAGVYELVFRLTEYFRAAGAALADPPFLGDVVIRFAVADPDRHYHVPLLAAPWGYTTYRGS